MESRRERPRVMAWLGMVAVLCNILASFLHMAPAKAIGSIDDILGPLVLCTEHGPQAVPGGDLPGGRGGEQRDGSGHCAACVLLVGTAILVAFLLVAVAFPVRIVLPFKSSARTLADHLSLGGIRSRAPPLSA